MLLLVALGGLAGCGRFGFAPAELDAPLVPGKDGFVPSDGNRAFDVALGVGSYAMTDTNVTYIALGGTVISGSSTADEQTYPLALPFTFAFYGVAYNSITVGADGWLSFTGAISGATPWVNPCPLDAVAQDAAVAVFWDDLVARSSGTTINYAASGTAPNRKFAVEWSHFTAWYQYGTSYFDQDTNVTQQVVLHESGVIDLHYGPRTAPSMNYDCGVGRHQGCSATVGLEAPGTTSMTTQCGTASGPAPGYTALVPGRMLSFTPM
ncbi:MAG: hypothetical protein JWO36_2468 [Myxococcales bacterium]|nr:hypothetical protein [Myxococcales bacterium]